MFEFFVLFGYFLKRERNSRLYGMNSTTPCGVSDYALWRIFGIRKNMDGNIFWQRIKQLLKKTKATLKDLADYMGISRRTLENWVYRGTIPYIHEGYLIARFFGVSVYFLITGREEKKQKNINEIRILLERAGSKLNRL